MGVHFGDHWTVQRPASAVGVQGRHKSVQRCIHLLDKLACLLFGGIENWQIGKLENWGPVPMNNFLSM